ncbi:MAG: TrkA family potassium uptake protein [Syntrophobacteraceae bacterium]
MRFIIVGCGRMGEGLARALSLRGHTVTVLDKNRDAMEHLEKSLQGRTLVGTGFDRGVLVQAGIEHADGLAAVTNSDEANVVIARLARLVFQVPRVVARLYDPRKADIYQRLGVQIVAPISWAIHRLADLLSYSEMDAILSLGSGEVEIVEVEVPPLLVGHKVGAIAVPGEVRVIALSRRGKAFLPSSETLMQKGDLAHIAVLTSSVERLRAILTLP